MSSVDVLLPYWGEFGLFKKTVDSVIAQSYKGWRLLIFDDCYPSGQAKKYIASLGDNRITYYRHKKNIGITNNFNYALQIATAPYCVIIGCDDIMLPSYLETAVNNIGDTDFYQPGIEVIDEHDQVYLPLVDRVKRYLRPKKIGTYSGEKLAQSICIGNWLYFPSIMWRTKTIKKYGFDAKYKIVEDLVLELSIIRDGGRLSYDTTVTFQYRRSASSLSSREKSKGGIRFNEESAVYDYFSQEFMKIGWSIAAKASKIHLTSRLHKLVTKFQ